MSPELSVTALLARARVGDRGAVDELIPLVYSELHRLADIAFRAEMPGHTLQPTALLHEALLRLFGAERPEFSDRAHLLRIASRVMRQILVDHARLKKAQKRGGGLRVQLTDRDGSSEAPMDELLELNDAMARLGSEDSRLVGLIEMRFFGGMTAEEIAEAGGESVHVVRHDLRYAQARLRRFLGHAAP